jgi:serine kinase of HPr protein (carbohydrate metabolism regulator)
MGNIHACAVILGDRGVLVTGPSGSGKSRLALLLVQHFRRQGRFARLVADDRVLLEAVSGRLAAAAPPPLAGLVEVRGFGPARVAAEPAAIVDLLVRLVPAAEAPRLQDPLMDEIEGCDVPCLLLAEHDSAGAASAVFAALAFGSYI